MILLVLCHGFLYLKFLCHFVSPLVVNDQPHGNLIKIGFFLVLQQVAGRGPQEPEPRFLKNIIRQVLIAAGFTDEYPKNPGILIVKVFKRCLPDFVIK